jgi:drug/metabolite transporter (DMT)-like permease
LTAFSAWHLVLLRFITASLVLLVAMAAARRRMLPPRAALGRVAVSGLAGFTVYHTALTLGERTVQANTASFIIAAAPLFTAVLGRIFLRERLAWLGWVGMSVSFLGVGVLSGFGGHLRLNALLIVLSAISTAVYFVVEKPLLEQFGALEVTAWVTWAGTLPMLAYWPGVVGAVQHAPLPPLLWVLYIGIFPAALAYVTWSAALSAAPASKVAPLLYLNPILASVQAWVILRERPGWNLAAGGLMILAGVFLIQRRGRESGPHRNEESAG